MGKTAAELMAELANNKTFQKLREEREKHFSALEKQYDCDEKELVE